MITSKGHHTDWNDHNTQTFSLDPTIDPPEPYMLMGLDVGTPATDNGSDWEHRAKVYDGTTPLIGFCRFVEWDASNRTLSNKVDAATVRLYGKDGTAKVLASAGIACGDYVKPMSDGSGMVEVGTAADNIGIKLTKGTSGAGDVIEILDN